MENKFQEFQSVIKETPPSNEAAFSYYSDRTKDLATAIKASEKDYIKRDHLTKKQKQELAGISVKANQLAEMFVLETQRFLDLDSKDQQFIAKLYEIIKQDSQQAQEYVDKMWITSSKDVKKYIKEFLPVFEAKEQQADKKLEKKEKIKDQELIHWLNLSLFYLEGKSEAEKITLLLPIFKEKFSQFKEQEVVQIFNQWIEKQLNLSKKELQSEFDKTEQEILMEIIRLSDKLNDGLSDFKQKFDLKNLELENFNDTEFIAISREVVMLNQQLQLQENKLQLFEHARKRLNIKQTQPHENEPELKQRLNELYDLSKQQEKDYQNIEKQLKQILEIKSEPGLAGILNRFRKQKYTAEEIEKIKQAYRIELVDLENTRKKTNNEMTQISQDLSVQTLGEFILRLQKQNPNLDQEIEVIKSAVLNPEMILHQIKVIKDFDQSDKQIEFKKILADIFKQVDNIGILTSDDLEKLLTKHSVQENIEKLSANHEELEKVMELVAKRIKQKLLTKDFIKQPLEKMNKDFAKNKNLANIDLIQGQLKRQINGLGLRQVMFLSLSDYNRLLQDAHIQTSIRSL